MDGGSQCLRGAGRDGGVKGGEIPVRDGARGAAVAGCRRRRGAGRVGMGMGTRWWRGAGKVGTGTGIQRRRGTGRDTPQQGRDPVPGWMGDGPSAGGVRAARPLRGPGAGRAGGAGSGRPRVSRSRRGLEKKLLAGPGGAGLWHTNPPAPRCGPRSLRRCRRPSAAGCGRRRPPCRWLGDDFGTRRVKRLYSDLPWKCLFSRLDMDLKVIRLALRCCPAVKARSRSAERRGGR